MQHAMTLSAPAIGKSFDPADYAIATAWGAARRAGGIKLIVATDHEAFPEVIEIAPPGTLEPKWCIWRDRSGRLIVDNWQTWERGRPFAGMAEALTYIAGEITSVQRFATPAL
jgi:hypothetical protein